jgi:uncharacterized protein YggE
MPGFFNEKHNRVLGTIVLITAGLALLSYAFLNMQMVKNSYPMPTNISVNGEGEASAIPNVGQFSFSVAADGKTAAEAQEKSGTKINEILAYLKEQGVEEKDVKTRDYNLSPRYKYNERPCAFNSYCPPSEPVADGFDVSQTVEVKVRDTAKSGDLISGVGDKGATNMSGLAFTVDDTSAVKAEARTKAIADAKMKTEKIAADLGVEIVRITSFYEMEGYYSPEPYMAKEMAMSEDADFGGANIPVGENTTKVQVSISYEVR